MRVSYSRFIIFSIPILTVVIVWGMACCGGPNVRHTSVSGKVRNVEYWSIEAVQDSILVNNVFPMIKESDQANILSAREEHIGQYLKDIKTILDSDGFKFSKPKSANGIIEIKLYWFENWDSRRKESSLDEEYRREKLRRTHSPETGYDSLSIEIPYPVSVFSSDSPIVRRAKIELLDRNGKSMCSIDIGKNENHKIKPEFIAEVLEKILKEGKY